MLVRGAKLTTTPHGKTDLFKRLREEILSGGKTTRTIIFWWDMPEAPTPPQGSTSQL